MKPDRPEIDPRFTRDDLRSIVQRAATLDDDRLSLTDVRAIAAELGMSQNAVTQAIEEVQSTAAREKVSRSSTRRDDAWGMARIGAVAGLIALTVPTRTIPRPCR